MFFGKRKTTVVVVSPIWARETSSPAASPGRCHTEALGCAARVSAGGRDEAVAAGVCVRRTGGRGKACEH